MGHLLDKPETEKKGGELKEVVEGNGNVLVMAATSMQGWRVEMEDAHTIKVSRGQLFLACNQNSGVSGRKGLRSLRLFCACGSALDSPMVSLVRPQDNFDEQLPGHHFVGVFDGHGGDYTSAWIAGQLLDYIRAEPSYALYKSSLTSSKPNFEELKIALKKGFLKADEKLRAAQNEEIPGDQSGSTGVVCIITPTHIVCANAGDSRAVMGVKVDERGFHDLSHDHKPENELEIARILRAGGNVSMKRYHREKSLFSQFMNSKRLASRRVDGDLAVSRSFGDFKFKENDELPAEEQVRAAADQLVACKNAATDGTLCLAPIESNR
eukprot:scaffold1437_cov268-Pinguiococcus_pyrenoidosus.AAC.3